MNVDEYRKMAEYENNYWWHIGRNYTVEKFLKKILKNTNKQDIKILNIGCGTGGTVSTLSQFGQVYNVDTEELVKKLFKDKGLGDVTLVEGTDLPFDDNFFDVVVSLDVLEHIDAENAALREWHRVLKPNGEALIMVPAHSWLWSAHDEALHHFRRYSRSHLVTAMRLADFKVTKKSYAVCFSFILVVGYRMISPLLKRKSGGEASYVNLPKPINWLFTKLLYAEGLWLTRANLPFGTSVLARGEKPSGRLTLDQ